MRSKLFILILLISATANLSAVDFTFWKSDNVSESYRLYRKSYDYFYKDTDSSEKYARQSLREANSAIDKAWAMDQIGKNLIVTNRTDSGFIFLNKARKIFLTEKYRPGLISIYIDFGTAFKKYGNLYEARKYYNKAFNLKSEKLEVDNELAKIYYALFSIESKLGNTRECKKYLAGLDSLYTVLEKDERYYSFQIDKAVILRYAGKYDEAIEFLERIKENSKISSNTALGILSEMGFIYYYKGEINKAISIYEEGLSKSKSISDSIDLMGNLIGFYILNDENEKAISAYFQYNNKLINNNDRLNFNINYAEALENLDSNAKAKKIYYEIKQGIDKSESFQKLEYLDELMRLVNRKDSVYMYKELLDYLPILIRKSEGTKKVNQEKESQLLKTILIADEEISARELIIKQRTMFLTIVLSLLTVIILAFILFFREHQKVKSLNQSIQKSYNILTQEINGEMRLIIQQVLELDREMQDFLPEKNDIKEAFDELLNNIMRILNNLRTK